jgi:cardiolipin synthase
MQAWQAQGGQVADYFAQQGLPRYESSFPQFYHTGTAWNARSLELIANAKDYILISIFLGNLHPSTSEVWDLLAQKIAQGVRVYCIMDSSSYFQLDPDTQAVVPAVMNHLRSLGIPMVEYNAFSLSQLAYIPRLFDRDHRKYWIVDGTYLALGGINVNYTSLGLPPETGNIDTMVEVRSPGAIGEMVVSFVNTWNSYSPDTLEMQDFAIEPSVPIEAGPSGRARGGSACGPIRLRPQGQLRASRAVWHAGFDRGRRAGVYLSQSARSLPPP